MKLAKQNQITVIIAGHVTKDGAIAGPRLLEHLVDGVPRDPKSTYQPRCFV